MEDVICNPNLCFLCHEGFQYCTAVLNTDFRIIFPGSKSQSLRTSSVTLDMELNLPKPQFPYL